MSNEQLRRTSAGHRIVILSGPKLIHRNTCATLIQAGLNIVGICVAEQRAAGLPLKYLVKSCEKKGYGVTLSRILGRLAYQCLNAAKDRKIFARLYNEPAINDVLRNWSGQTHETSDYGAKETLSWVRSLEPDILVVHSPYWVGKAVRNIPKTGIVLGGHPGITPCYRGSHSAFWAVYSGNSQDVGCTVFLVGSGVDTGDIVVQERIAIEPGDSFVTLGWKGMIRIAQLQAKVLRDLDQGVKLESVPITSVPPRSEFDNPTFREFARYRSVQSILR